MLSAVKYLCMQNIWRVCASGVLPCSKKKETRIFHDSMVVREKKLKSPKENKFWLRFSHKGPLRDCYSDLSDKMPYRMEEKCLFLYTLA